MFIPKDRDKKYLEYIREHPCFFCNAPPKSEPHHIRGIDGMPSMGMKPSDYLVLPACRSCHDKDQGHKLDSDPVLNRWNKEKRMAAIIFYLTQFVKEHKRG